MSRTHDVHVLPDFVDGWDVYSGGRIVSHHRTQKEAMAAGRRIARHERVDLVTWNADGQIRSKDSYGNESASPDKEH
jgi:redox-sensitive bicupin YhaK (pirin superfamily)